MLNWLRRLGRKQTEGTGTLPKDLAIPPEMAPADRHFQRPDPRLDSSGTMSKPLKDQPPPFFLGGTTGIKEGHEDIMRFLMLSTNALSETDVERREHALREALALADKIKDDPNAVDALQISLGNLYGNLAGVVLVRPSHSYEENRAEAYELFERAIAQFKETEDTEGLWKTHYNLAVALSSGLAADRFTDIDLAMSHTRQAIGILRSENRDIPFEVVLNFASFAANSQGERRQGNLREAIALVEPLTTEQWHQSQADIWASAQNTLGALKTSLRGADVGTAWAEGLTAFDRALEVRTKATNPLGWAQTTLNRINVLAALDEAFFEAAPRTDAAADVANLKGAMAELESAGRGALAAAAARSTGRRLLSMAGHAALAERPALLADANELLGKALRFFSPDRAGDDFVETAEVLFDVLVAQQEDELAADLGITTLRVSQSLEEGGVQVERIREISSKLNRLGASTAMLHLIAHRPELALEAIEIARARYLQASLRLKNVPHPDESMRNIRARMRDLERIIQTESNPSHSSIEEFATLRKQLLTKISTEPGGGSTNPIELILQVLPDYGAFAWLVISEIGSSLVVLMNGPGGTQIRIGLLEADRFKNDSSLPHAWARAYSAAKRSGVQGQARWLDDIEDLSSQLWQTVVAKLVSTLQSCNVAPGAHVVIFPPGDYAVLPFALAHDKSSGRRLLDLYEVSVAPSIASLTGKPDGRVPSLLAVINPTGDLPFTAVEASEAGRQFNGLHSIILRGQECTQDAIIAAAGSTTHWLFSTHSVFDPRDPRRCAIRLARDQVLTLDSLLGSDLLGGPRIVVLSACESGLQDVARSPDEFIGFPTAFLQLGAKGVIATLWPVSDASAALLAAHVFQGLLQEQLPASAALRKAQLWIRNASVADLKTYVQNLASSDAVGADRRWLESLSIHLSELPSEARAFQHPFHWGAFTLFGH
jgi:CHAT domain-containing protein